LPEARLESQTTSWKLSEKTVEFRTQSGSQHERSRVLEVIQHSTFNTPDEVVNILQRLSRSAQPPCSASTRRKGQREQRVPQTHSEAHRLGQTACWKAWGDRARVSFTGHALRGAPHYFRICRRADIGLRLDDHGHDTSSERSPVTTNLLTAA
jgi:hypothetical protein